MEGLWYKSYPASPVLGLAGWLFGTGYLFMYDFYFFRSFSPISP